MNITNKLLNDGELSRTFEKNLATYLDMRWGVLCSSPHFIALISLTNPELQSKTMKSGDEVITTSLMGRGIELAIKQAGFVPIFADVNIPSYNPNQHLISDKITERTKAIFVPHNFGQTYNCVAMRELADSNDLWLLEEFTQSFGSEYEKRKAGAWGDVSIMQTEISKQGAIFTNSCRLQQIIENNKQLYNVATLDYASRFGNNFLLFGLEYYTKLWKHWWEFLYDRLDGIRLQSKVILPNILKNCLPNWKYFPITFKSCLSEYPDFPEVFIPDIVETAELPKSSIIQKSTIIVDIHKVVLSRKPEQTINKIMRYIRSL